MRRTIGAAMLVVVLLTASSCDNPEREKARQECEAAGGTFIDSQADDGSDVWSCVA